MKRILLSVMTIALVSGVAFGATRAFFSDTEKSVGNTFTAGTIDISVASQNPWNTTYPMLLDKPSLTNYVNFTIQNVGNNDANVWKRINNVIANGGASTFCSLASSEPEYAEGGGTFNSDGTCTGLGYVERDDLDSYMVYDLYVCPGQVGVGDCIVEGTTDEERASGKPTGTGWKAIIPEANQVRVDNVNGVWVKLVTPEVQQPLQPGGKLAVSQSYHLTAWDDAQEPTVNNWAQGDEMKFDIELEARQATAPAPGSTELATLELKEKDSITWDVVSGASGILSYHTSGNTFNYGFTASGLNNNTEYSLIYYADPYPGNHPGKLIATMTTGGTGVVVDSGNVELGMDLPQSGDANYPAGAKIQLVLSSDYAAGTHALTAWNPTEYLFEMGLITYEDTNN